MIINQIERHFQELKEGNVDEAISQIKKCLDHQNMTDELRFEIATQLFEFGFLDEAIEIVQRLYETHPHEHELALFLAELYMEKDEDDEALSLLLTIEPGEEDFIRASLLAADLYLVQGIYEAAEYKIKQALEVDPDEKILHTALGEVFYHQEKYQLAILSYEKGNIDSSYEKLADCYAHLGQFEKALDFYEQATNNTGDPDVLFGYGFVAFQLEKWDLAVSTFNKLIEADPHYTSVYPLMVDAYVQLGQGEEALQCVEEGLKYDQTNPHLYYVKGELFLRDGNVQKAKELFEQSLTLDEAYTLSLDKLLEIAEDEGEWEDGLRYVNKLLEVASERGDLYTKLGLLYEELEEWAKAEQSYRQAIRVNEDYVDAYNRLGFLLRDEGKLEEALTLWKKSLQIAPDQWDIEELLAQQEERI